MFVSPARTADLPQILAMIRALSAFHNDTATLTLEGAQDAFFGSQDRAIALLARADRGGPPVGYAGLIPALTLHTGVLRMDIHHLYVREAHRSRGVGRALIAAAAQEARARGADRLTIGTDAGNLTAQAAYRAMGLEEITGAGPRFRISLD